LLITLDTIGAMKNIDSIVKKIEVLTASKKKLLTKIIRMGINDCKYLLFVSRGMKIAVASIGEKLGGNPINLLAINIRIIYKKFLFMI
jgi:hypothetical protein